MTRALRTVAIVVAGAASLLWLGALAPPAPAEPICNAPEPPSWCHDEPDGEEVHDPAGSLTRVLRVPGGVHVEGWAEDPDAAGPINVRVTVPPHVATNLLADGPPHDGHGFAGFMAVAAGEQVCAKALNFGPGADRTLGCRNVPIRSDPVGHVEAAERVPGGVQLRGWALDPDSTAPIDVHVYDGGPAGAGGSFAASATANRDRSQQGGWGATYSGYGVHHGFDAVVPAATDTPRVCAHAINVGAGSVNTMIGCRGLPPASPSGLKAARAQDLALSVEWQDGSLHEDGYRVQLRRPDASWTEVATAPALAGGGHRVAVPVPTPGPHCVRVTAVNASGSSPPVEACGDTTPPAHRISVLTLNLVGDDDAWDDGTGREIPVPWRERYDRVARWMAASGTLPDVMTLQEVYANRWHLPDYETLFVLLDRIKARTGADYRIAHLGTRKATATISAGGAVLYNAGRLRNTTPSGGDTAFPDQYPFEPLNALHARRSYPCAYPSDAFRALCASIDGTGVYWTASYRHPSGTWGPGPTFSSFELLADPGSHVHVYNVHASLDSQSHYYGELRRLVAAVETRWSSRTRLYPPLLTGDFNATLGDPGNLEFAAGAPFADFEVAAFSVVPDEIGILKGRHSAFPARDAGVASAQILPVPGPKAPNCGAPSVLWSDHCAVFVELLPSRPLPPVARQPQPNPPPLGPRDEEPPQCRSKPYLPGCGGP